MNSDDFGGLINPDLKSVRGIRVWNLYKGRLRGMVGDWGPDLSGVHQADCIGSLMTRSCPEGGKVAGSSECSCGFYAFYSMDKEDMAVSFPFSVFGVIDGFGTVATGTKGFRCSEARILALCPQTIYIPGYTVMSSWYRQRLIRARADFQVGKEVNEWFPMKYMDLSSAEFPPGVDTNGIPVFSSIETMMLEFPPSRLEELLQ